MRTSLTEDRKAFKQAMCQLEEQIFDRAMEWARNIYKAILEYLDELINKKRDKTLKVIHKRDTWYRTRLGQVKVKRRHYCDQSGKYHYLLDEALGMEKYRHTTLNTQHIALELVSNGTFRGSADILRKTTAIDLSHQTLKRFLDRAADVYLKNMDNEIKHLMRTGEITEGDRRKVKRLMLEADGVMLSLQREKARKVEVKLGIAYEDYDRVGKDRYRTVNKTIYADVATSDRFWAGFTLKLQRKYDLAGINQVILGGDGASWVKDGLGYFGGKFQLSRYHLNRELCRVLGQLPQTEEALKSLRDACASGDITSVSQILETLAQATKGKHAEEIRKLQHYLISNASGLKDYRKDMGEEATNLRGTGAIEGNVDKLVVRRMKNKGMSWSLKGIRSMLCIRFMVKEGTLKEWLCNNTPESNIPVISRKRMNRVIDKAGKRDYFDWFNAGLPALYGPHASRPWARMLKSLTEVRI